MQNAMKTSSLKVLILEDVPTDAELVEQELRSAGIEFMSVRVDTRDGYLGALERLFPDIILSDYLLPAFDGESALAIAREKAPAIPFIFVTGALGEERAVDLLKGGATDFVLKDRLGRLPFCVKRALAEAKEKQLRREAEEDLRRAYAEEKFYTRMIEQSNRYLRDFVHAASHDLQEPVRKIQTFADLLENGYQEALDETGRDCVKRIRRCARRAQDLIRDLLIYSRLSSRSEAAETDLRGPAQEAVIELGAVIESTEARIEISWLPAIEADVGQMRLLFRNLIGNAIKHRGKEKPLVRVFAGEADRRGFHQIRVEDNGIGFDERYLDKIFRPFQKLYGRGEGDEGTGMGLAICRRIVERHGGSITARSQPGKGAVFLVSLPELQPDPGAAASGGIDEATDADDFVP